eukprot:PhM_4_TR7869/c0_g1_i1/m.66169/K15503/ANKRD44; serine/threonine-protein phosphatase 6 regulatory ankyrin repeat subunit B
MSTPLDDSKRSIRRVDSRDEKYALRFTIEGKDYVYEGTTERREADFFHLYVKLKRGNINFNTAVQEFRHNVPSSTLTLDEIAVILTRQKERYLLRYQPQNTVSPDGGLQPSAYSAERSIDAESVPVLMSTSDRRSRSRVLEVSTESDEEEFDDDRNQSGRQRRVRRRRDLATSPKREAMTLSEEALHRHNLAQKQQQRQRQQQGSARHGNLIGTKVVGTPQTGSGHARGTSDVPTMLREVLRKTEEISRSVHTPNTTPTGGTAAVTVPETMDVLMRLIERDADDMAPIHHAASRNDVRAIQELVQLGAHVDTVRTSDGATPLLLACENGAQLALHALLQCGASLSARDHRGAGALHYAAQRNHVDVVVYLVARGCSVRDLDSSGRTALHYALLPETQGPHLDVISCLLRHGADVNSRDSLMYRTPLHYAAMWGWCTAVKFLCMNGAEVWAEDAYAENAVFIAAERQHSDVVHVISELQEPEQAWTAVHLSAIRGQEIINQLMTLDPEQVNATDVKGRTAMHLAAMADHKALVDLMMAKGEDLDATDNKGNTALHDAAARGQVGFVRSVLHFSRSWLEIANKEGNTPYFMALHHGHYEMCQLLVEAGCDTALTPEQMYRLKRRRRMLVSHSSVCAVALRQELNHQTLSYATQIDKKDELGRTPLHCSAFVGDLEAAQLLLMLRPNDVHVRDHDGNSVLHWAVMADVSPGVLSQRKAVTVANIVHALIEADVSQINARNKAGQRPIDVASDDNLGSVVALMNAFGAPRWDLWYKFLSVVSLFIVQTLYFAFWPILLLWGYFLCRNLPTCALRGSSVLHAPRRRGTKPYTHTSTFHRSIKALLAALGAVISVVALAIFPIVLVNFSVDPVALHEYLIRVPGANYSYMVSSDVTVPTTCSNYSSPIGVDYNGSVHWTVSGILCAAWPSNKYPSLQNVSLCRNPDGRTAAWCYTQSPNIEWDYCAVEESCSTERTTASPTPEPTTTNATPVPSTTLPVNGTTSPPTVEPTATTTITHSPFVTASPRAKKITGRAVDTPFEELNNHTLPLRTKYLIVICFFALAFLMFICTTLRKALKEPAALAGPPQKHFIPTFQNCVVLLDAVLHSLGLAAMALAACDDASGTTLTLKELLKIFILDIDTTAAHVVSSVLLLLWFLCAGHIIICTEVLTSPAWCRRFPIVQPTFIHHMPFLFMYLLPRSLAIPIYAVLVGDLRCEFSGDEIGMWSTTDLLCFESHRPRLAMWTSMFLLYLYCFSAMTVGSIATTPKSRSLTIAPSPLKTLCDHILTFLTVAGIVVLRSHPYGMLGIVVAVHVVYLLLGFFFYPRYRCLGIAAQCLFLMFSLTTTLSSFAYLSNGDGTSVTIVGAMVFVACCATSVILVRLHKASWVRNAASGGKEYRKLLARLGMRDDAVEAVGGGADGPRATDVKNHHRGAVPYPIPASGCGDNDALHAPEPTNLSSIQATETT